jgi:hypothetical protein
MIDANWSNDMINGEGKLIKTDGRVIECIFYNNAKVELSSQTEGCYDRAGCSICCTIFIYGFLALFIIYNQPAFIVGIVFFLIANMIECCNSNSYEYFKNNIV